MKRKLFIGVYNPSIILTYISVFCSILGIGKLLFSEKPVALESLDSAMILLIIAGICDMFDGRIARLCKRTDKEKEFGIQLDSLADTVSFVVFPVIILLSITNFSISGILIAMLYAFTGIMRLGWFNVTTEENKGFFVGLPVTLSALIFPAFFVVFRIIDCSFEAIVMQIVWSIVALLFVLNFKLKKPNLVFSIVMILLAIGVVTLILIL